MTNNNRRQNSRIKSINLISFVGMGADNQSEIQGICKSLNISQSGILIESLDQINSRFVSLLSTDMDNNLTEISGRVVYSEKDPFGKFRTGIKFTGNQTQIKQFVVNLVRVNLSRKYYRTDSQSGLHLTQKAA